VPATPYDEIGRTYTQTRREDPRIAATIHACLGDGPRILNGFGIEYDARPEAYLRPDVQAGMSWLARTPPDVLRRGSERLAADLASGKWDRRFGALREREWFDGGYRITIAE
jgi:hypothetical protein